MDSREEIYVLGTHKVSVCVFMHAHACLKASDDTLPWNVFFTDFTCSLNNWNVYQMFS